MVERFFRDITAERLRRSVFTSVPELVTAINDYVAHHDANPRPFIWTNTAGDILQKVIRTNARLSSKQNGTGYQRDCFSTLAAHQRHCTVARVHLSLNSGSSLSKLIRTMLEMLFSSKM